MTNPADIARALSEAQRRAIPFLTSEWQSPYDLKRLGQKGGFTVLEALHRRGIADERQDRGSMFMPHTQYKYRLTDFGLQVRDYLVHRPTIDASTDRNQAKVVRCGKEIE